MQKQTIEYKIIIVGESGIGKTCIIKRLFDDKFNPSELASTPNLVVKGYEFNNFKLSLNIWDTAGQEQYRSIQKIFFNSTDAVIMVYDITNSDSFKELKSFWYNQIKNYCPESIGK